MKKLLFILLLGSSAYAQKHIVFQSYIDSADGLRLLKTDTGAFLTAYRNEINARIKYTDSTTLLAAYQTALLNRVKFTDTAAMLAAYQTALLARVRYSDTTSILAAYQTALLVRAKYSDTSTFLSAYQTALLARMRYNDTSTVLAAYKTALLARMKYTDTSTALAAYQTAINSRAKYSDTTSILAPYQTAINSRVKYTDTTTELASYQTALNNRVKYSDTTAMLAAYKTALGARSDTSVTNYFQRSMQTYTVGINAQSNGGAGVIGTGLQGPASGTLTARTIATTNIFTQFPRVGYVPTAAVGSIAGVRHNSANAYFGDAAGKGGFDFSHIGGSSSTTNIRGFVVFAASIANITTEPSVGVNFFGFAYASATTNWKFWYNDGTGTADSIDLGASFPVNTASDNMYQFQLSCKGNEQKVYYQLTNLSTGAVANGTVSTNLPSTTTLLSYQVNYNTGAVNAAASMDLVNLYYSNRYGLNPPKPIAY